MERDYRALMWDEVADIGAFLHEIDDDDFDAPTLCEGWRVRDVIGHMSYGHSTPLLPLLGGTLKYRGKVDQASFNVSKEWASERTPAEIRAFWDGVMIAQHPRKGIAKFIKDRDGYLDHFVHHQDMRRPLGRPRDVADDRLLAVLDAIPRVQSPMFGTRKPTAGLHLEATDVDWTFGDGPEVRGPGEAIVMAAAGRTAALDELSGEGAAVLTERIKR